ncbi:hypothetical protein SLE2022_399380 [Rubroshorea leprosula]
MNANLKSHFPFNGFKSFPHLSALFCMADPLHPGPPHLPMATIAISFLHPSLWLPTNEEEEGLFPTLFETPTDLNIKTGSQTCQKLKSMSTFSGLHGDIA